MVSSDAAGGIHPAGSACRPGLMPSALIAAILRHLVGEPGASRAAQFAGQRQYRPRIERVV